MTEGTTAPEQGPAMAPALRIECSATVTRADGTTDEEG